MNGSVPLPHISNKFVFSMGQSNPHWFFKYKLYHIFFWIIYHYLWAVIKVGDPLEVAHYIFSSTPAFKFIFYVVFQAIAVYFNLYFLMPRFLEKSRFAAYILCLLLTILFTAFIIVYGYYLTAVFTDRTIIELYGTDEISYFFMTYTLPSTMASMTLAMSIKLAKNWIQSKRRQQLLEKEKLETELKFLRSQFNPHFLFNTINSIFVLIHKNPTMASEALAKFSDLLRYQLYDCNAHEIPFSQELTYLENFIELEKLRHDTSNLELTLKLEQQYPPALTIAPFVLIPFIENAFKHVSKRKDQLNWIKINLWFHHHKLYFDIANSISARDSTSPEFIRYRGIGLKNVQRRLDLIYPKDHELFVEQQHDQFQVKLYLNLHVQRADTQMAKQIEP